MSGITLAWIAEFGGRWAYRPMWYPYRTPADEMTGLTSQNFSLTSVTHPTRGWNRSC